MATDYETNDHASNINRPKVPHDMNKTSFPPKRGPVSNKTRWPKVG